MANTNSLSTGTNTGSQTTTQSPQTSAAPTGYPGAQTSAVQPGTTSTLLTSTGGIPLQSTQLSTVSLSGTSTTTTHTLPSTQTPHHINPVMFGFALLLFIVAIYLFWTTSHPAKNTTI